MLNSDQLHILLQLSNRQLLFFAGSTLGPQVLNDQEKELLSQNGVDWTKIYEEKKDLVNLNFHLGMLSNILGKEETKNLTFDQLKHYIQSGAHIPLNKRERATVANIKMQSMSDIRANGSRIFQDINNVVGNELYSARANQEDFLREQIVEGTISRQSRKQIVRNIARLTGDWSRNFGKSVQYISHTALNEGRAAMVHRRHGDNERGRVYFLVQPTACISCKKVYLDNGGEPRIFTLQELEKNGTNIGRKQKDWQATVGPIHINCRCLITEYIEGMVWNGSKFTWPEGKKEPHSARPKVRIVFNGQEHWV